ncbi:hypothetical protein JHN59_37525 [Streptomyces sp. MBT49]|uniref:hypothetical protein n=1 Tax=Streptomyces sp. MBT49 TaxID=1488380 RepID=UPI00190DB2D5|nr:hypothetical protein [Streptomyces sp. MBT49]MBK3630403.1 hypothetical protein [Streptomyces sp. MBT49]
MTTASQTPGPMPAETVVAERHRGTLAAATGVISAAMSSGATAAEDIAKAELAAGLLFDPQAAADIAAAAAEQAHADDAAEIAERGRQLARMAGAVRQRDAVLRLCEGRPGTHLLTVAEVAAAAEYGTTPLDHFPLLVAWTGDVRMPRPADVRPQTIVECVTPHGAHVGVIVEDRQALASRLGADVRDTTAPCPTEDCGAVEDFDASDPSLSGWARVEIAGIEDGAPRWYCSAPCVADALARAGTELTAVDQAAAARPDSEAADLPYGGDVLPEEPKPAPAPADVVDDQAAMGGAW